MTGVRGGPRVTMPPTSGPSPPVSALPAAVSRICDGWVALVLPVAGLPFPGDGQAWMIRSRNGARSDRLVAPLLALVWSGDRTLFCTRITQQADKYGGLPHLLACSG